MQVCKVIYLEKVALKIAIKGPAEDLAVQIIGHVI